MSSLVTIPRWDRLIAMHHCAVCGNILKHPEAMRSCLGSHCSVCAGYHPLFHYVGKSHQCKACSHGRELREERLRNIARLVGVLARLESETDWSVVTSKPTKSADRIRLNVVKPSEVEAVRKTIADLTEEEHKKEIEFEEIMRANFNTSTARDEGFLRTFLLNHSTTEQLNTLTDDALTALCVVEPSGSGKKENTSVYTTLKTGIFEIFDVAARDVVEYRKRRVAFALFITASASDKLESELIDWDHVTGAKKQVQERRPSTSSSDDIRTAVSSGTDSTTPDQTSIHVSRLLASQCADSRTGGRVVGKNNPEDIRRPSTPPPNPVADNSVAFWGRLNWMGRAIGAHAFTPLFSRRLSRADSRSESRSSYGMEGRPDSRADFTGDDRGEVDTPCPSPCPTVVNLARASPAITPKRLVNKRRIDSVNEMYHVPRPIPSVSEDTKSSSSEMAEEQAQKETVQPRSPKKRPTIILKDGSVVFCDAEDPLAYMDPTIKLKELVGWPGKEHWFVKKH